MRTKVFFVIPEGNLRFLFGRPIHARSSTRIGEVMRYDLPMKFAVAALALAAPLAVAQSTTPLAASGKPLAFSIVSIRPHGDSPGGGYNVAPDCRQITVTNMTLSFLIDNAYNLKDGRFLVGGPSWFDTARLDVEAKLDPADIPAARSTEEQCLALLQPVLADRFRLKVHHEARPILVYNVVIAKGGLKMKESVPPAGSAQPAPCRIDASRRGSAIVHSCSMDMITHMLEDGPGRFVVDQTGLTGRYDFELHYTPDNTPADSPLAGGLSIFTAVQEQLGLKLEPSTASLDILVIDSAQKPSAN